MGPLAQVSEAPGLRHWLVFFISLPEDIPSLLFGEREEGRERNIDAREKHQLVSSRRQTRTDQGQNPQLRHVP